ncbi:Casein kinase II subunit alpha [Tritrichomonas foetus]|uniref:non-specific serine/threonine protein kinase n=1 Tax=Tritrichomonas foetus TaxID=1144522 RepID=A0A1J4J0A7_9EUKA|nr:Casein kinase II subunit alpha [Tritrichomonas foetus]|eukprot:OHS93032.1 Casein kinase II subunit alpha [Tritrichomonas foetus]
MQFYMEKQAAAEKNPEKPMANVNLNTNYKINSVSRAYPEAGRKLFKSLDCYETTTLDFGDIENYTVKTMIGSGRFSVVFIGIDKNGNDCAIKTYRPIPVDFIKRELFFMKVVRNIPNTLHFYDLIKDPLTGTIAHVCEYVKTGRKRIDYRSFTLDEVRFYMYQLLLTLDACHSIGIMHRDVKPDNLLINREQKKIRLIDWGLADIYYSKQQYNTGVGTLRYRGPELFLGYRYYDYAVDIWAAGITFGEMLIRYPFFEVNYQEELIHEVSDLLTTSAILVYAEKFGIDISDSTLRSMPEYTFFDWDSLINQGRPEMRDPDASDLLRKMLTVDHQQRITAHEALEHKFFYPLKKQMAEANSADQGNASTNDQVVENGKNDGNLLDIEKIAIDQK